MEENENRKNESSKVSPHDRDKRKDMPDPGKQALEDLDNTPVEQI
jgi:hypothetical protein